MPSDASKMGGAVLAFAVLVALAGCTGPCDPGITLVPLARATYEIEWNEVDARAGMLKAGFEPQTWPSTAGAPDARSSVYASNGAVTLISRATAEGSELVVSFVGAGERGVPAQSAEDAKDAAERDLAPALLSLLGAFEEGSTWTRAAEPSWDHAVSQEACA